MAFDLIDMAFHLMDFQFDLVHFPHKVKIWALLDLSGRARIYDIQTSGSSAGDSSRNLQ